ncbi:CBO0543 family protein [Halalkalibacter sp. APA_J-10(15)]|uniref:CBO0543 family protein n=1 Tax=unclassified Halalkalibacter TaxID=2893063 RepID=UPI001FF41974|nr:CBO0543 family protein [Halalkalibacter sp. APA_J-10(15)]MCK0471012.1 hypothetical protein [Halalkalibacter sp. APA_J-10(15)]
MSKKQEQSFLFIITVISIVFLPFAIIKRSFKDWIIVYLVSVIGNSFIDRYLVSKGYLGYNVRPFKKLFSIHFPFDFIHYPLMLLYYNQWTLHNKPFISILKLFPFIIPLVIVETWAAKKSHLINWKKGWTWYHSLCSLAIKFLLCRSIIATIRVVNNGSVSVK